MHDELIFLPVNRSKAWTVAIGTVAVAASLLLILWKITPAGIFGFNLH